MALLIVLAFIGVFIFAARYDRERKSQQLREIQTAAQVKRTALANLQVSLPGFAEAERIISADSQKIIALDKPGKQVAFCWIQDGRTYSNITVVDKQGLCFGQAQ